MYEIHQEQHFPRQKRAGGTNVPHLLDCLQQEFHGPETWEIDLYLAQLRGKPEEHGTFTKMCKKYIQDIEDGSESSVTALKWKGSLKAEVVKEENCAGRRSISRWTFVEEHVWAEIYKQLPQYASRLGERDSGVQTDNGEKDGFWIRGEFNCNLDGHHLFEYYDEQRTTITKVHADGGSPLEPEQAQNKYNVLVDQQHGTKHVQDKAKKLSIQDMLSIVNAAGSVAATSADGQGTAVEVEVDSSSDDEDEEESDLDFRESSLFSKAAKGCKGSKSTGGNSKGGVAKSSGSATKGAQSTGAAASFPARASPPEVCASAGVAVRAGSGSGALHGAKAHVATNLTSEDGRSRRLRENLEMELRNLQDDIRKLKTSLTSWTSSILLEKAASMWKRSRRSSRHSPICSRRSV